jgi:predicted NUDIX family NTP pyrophosphohydrolase
VAVTTDKSGRTSAGILLRRRRNNRLEVLLAHMGGPYWVNKDLGHWTIPKGEVEEGEELVAVARREFAEETGHQLPDTPLIELGAIRQKSGKLVLAWGPRAIWTPRRRSATPISWSGRPDRGVSRPSPRSTASNGSSSTRRVAS